MGLLTPTQNIVISTEGGALAAAVERPPHSLLPLPLPVALAVAPEIGPGFSLGTYPVLPMRGFNPRDMHHPLSNIQEVTARSGRVIAIEGDQTAAQLVEYTIYTPPHPNYSYPSSK